MRPPPSAALPVPGRRPAAWLLLFAAGLLAAAAAHADFAIRARMAGGIQRVYLEDVATYYGLGLGWDGNTLILANDHRRVDLVLGERQARINFITVHLFYAPVLLEEGYPVIAERDLTLILDPMLRSQSLPRARVQRIVLDPGHGGHDSGARGKRYLEKDINLLIALRTRDLLARYGYQVLLTREDDTFIPLTGRGTIAREWQADLIISIHCNAAAATSAAGIETFVLTPLGAPTTYHQEPETTSVIGNRQDRLNAHLGWQVHRYLIATTNANDRGIKHARWQVLVQAEMPAILVETGFISNSDEERQLGSAEYQQRLAVGLASGVIAVDRALQEGAPESP